MNSKKELLNNQDTVNVIKAFFGPAQFSHVRPWLDDFVKNGPNDHERAGFVYVYARAADIKRAGHVILHKVGHTVRGTVKQRIAEQEQGNIEEYTAIMAV